MKFNLDRNKFGDFIVNSNIGISFSFQNRYITDGGLIELDLCECYSGENCIELISSFKSPCKPDIVFPIHNAWTADLQSVFVQGFASGGPAGVVKTDEIKNRQVVYSYGFIICKTTQGYIAFYVADNRNYISRFDMQYNIRDNAFYLSAGFIIEQTADSSEFPVIGMQCGNNFDELLNDIAVKTTSVYNPQLKAPAYHWCSWYYYYFNFSMELLKEFLDGLKTVKNRIDINYIQIDAGYFTSAGDWLCPNSLWPEGLKGAFELIRSYGYKPGIWIAPYMVGNRSNLFSRHPEWMLKDKNGSRIIDMKNYNEAKLWGYKDEEYYILDTSNPDAMSYITNVFRVLKEWGAEFFKTDFMMMGMRESGHVSRHIPGLTSVAYYRQFMDNIKKEIGDSYWLGCIAPLLPSLGYVNGMRIARDVQSEWTDDEYGPSNMFAQLTGENYVNGIYWQNDPDAVLLRDFHTYMSEDEVTALAPFQAISGGMIYTSDILHKIKDSRLELFRFIKPGDEIKIPYLPFREKDEKIILLVHKTNKRYIVLLLNSTRENQKAEYNIQEIFSVPSLYIKEWKNDNVSGEKEKSIKCDIPAHCAVLLFCSEDSVIISDPENIWEQIYNF